MDYVEALMAVAESLGDIRRRLIALEAQVEAYDGDTPSVEALVERIENLEVNIKRKPNGTLYY